MAQQVETVTEWAERAKVFSKAWASTVPREELLRLSGIQKVVDQLLCVLEREAFGALFELLTERGAAEARGCPKCGLKTDRERKSCRINTKRLELRVDVWRYRCRACNTARSPVRDWLGLESGQTTIGLDRALASLAVRMSFEDAAKQMQEQHGHEVDRTLVQRRTYAAARLAEDYLGARRKACLDAYQDRPGKAPGAVRVDIQVDSGGVRTGSLQRPPVAEATAFTPVRRLPKGTRPSARREIRAIVAHKPGELTNKIIDLHVAPLGCPEFTGHRMFCAALEAGLGDETHVHMTSDMADWQKHQFQEQFSAQPRHTHCADFYHAQEYVSAAGPGLKIKSSELKAWRARQAGRLLNNDLHEVLREFRAHTCNARRGCPQTDKGECAVKAAERYLTRNGKHMDYKAFVDEGLPIGSGEVEGLIRHAVRRRLDIPGDWTEPKLAIFTALLTVFFSGWWEDFWRWVDQRDRAHLRKRLRGEIPNRFRGNPKPRPVADGTERLDLADLSPMFAAALGA
jgi:hypothetical protein